MNHNKSLSFFLFTIFLCLNGLANSVLQQRNTRQEYINAFAQLAIQEMNEYHIPASITMAQACLESSDGKSILAVQANNHFGIKCNNSWTGPSMRKDDDEHDECFRKYKTATESFRDHSDFLTSRIRYQFLFDYGIKDYRKWAYGLKKAGYATDPQYPERLIKIIEEFQLHNLDEYYNSSIRYLDTERLGGDSKTNTKRKGKSQIDDFLINPYLTRNVEKRNGSNAFFSKEGDSYEQIASEFSLKEWKVFKYNDVEKGTRLEKGSIVFLQSKRGSAPRGNDFHVMKQGESLWSVAQWYGVRLNALYDKNRMNRGEKPISGQQITLRKKLRK